MAEESVKCTVLYRPKADVRETARQILDDVLTIHAAVCSMRVTKSETETALRNIQHQARRLLAPGGSSFGPVEPLEEFVSRIERGEHIPPRELKLALVSVDMAAAKIRRHIYGSVDGVKKEGDNAAA